MILHRDLKPENFLISNSDNKDLFLIDFGMAKRFLDNNGQHIPLKKNRPFRGTYNFCSKNMIKGYESSRRDDLESLLYVLVYLNRGNEIFLLNFFLGFLPWQSISGDHKEIARVKMMTSNTEIFLGMPQEFLTIIEDLQKLKFSEEPKYGFYIRLLEDVLSDYGIK